MAEQDFEGLLQAFLQDLNGDGIPDGMQIDQAAPMTNRDRGMIQRRAMAGREPGPIDQARLAADMPRLEENSNALASTAAEFTGLPAVMRGGQRVAEGISAGRPLQAAAGVGEAALGMMPYGGAIRAAAPVMNALAGREGGIDNSDNEDIRNYWDQARAFLKQSPEWTAFANRFLNGDDDPQSPGVQFGTYYEVPQLGEQ